MNKSFLRSVALGALLGLAPFLLCAAFYYSIPMLMDGNPGALLSFAVLGLYMFTFVTTIIISVILIVRKNTTMGGAALVTLALQFVLLIGFLAGVY
jgi:hypothetical protein